jgi:hypothetical protein
MTDSDIVRRRLYNQHLVRPSFKEPHELVAWLGAVQAQDYPAAKWAVGLRLRGATDALLEQAFAGGTILRTHVMRPTWHFVARDDIRWMLSLTAPRVKAVLAHYDRMLELDKATLSRSHRALTSALSGEKMLTRSELAVVLRDAGIATDNLQRLAHLMAHAELAAVVCSGAPRGKQQTYCLLEERAPAARILPRDEALAELATRYFMSHGPATLRDYVWWSGLTMAEAKASVDLISARLTSDIVDGRTYWWTTARLPGGMLPQVYLLPNFDEYIVGYTNRSAICDVPPANSRENILFSHTVLVDGCVVGSWKRIVTKEVVSLSITLSTRAGRLPKSAIVSAAERYGQFLGIATSVTFVKA